LTGAYDDLFEGAELRLLPMGQSVVRKAAQLRADLPALRTPDALHAATALLAACTMFLTNDSGFRRVGGLPVVVLDDVARA
jgi:predicted nucleic acid-binding protein